MAKGKWREIRWYAKGTPTKTTKRLRRLHLFKAGSGYLTGDLITPYRSLCGLNVFETQLCKGMTDARLCGNCVKALNARNRIVRDNERRTTK